MASSIHSKIIEIQKEIQSVKKDGTNQMQRYKYISHEEVIKAIRAGMIKHGVTYYSNLLETTVCEVKTKNSTMKLARSMFEHFFYDYESKTEVRFINEGWGTDTLDKAIYKANTGAKKYAFFTLFMLVDGIEGKPTDPEYEESIFSKVNAAIDRCDDMFKHSSLQEYIQANKNKLTQKELAYIEADMKNLSRKINNKIKDM